MTHHTCTVVATQPGGFWINLGPLLYHWADSHTYLEGGELSLELCLEDVLAAAKALGFEMLQQQTVHNVGYMTNPRCVGAWWLVSVPPLLLQEHAAVDVQLCVLDHAQAERRSMKRTQH